MSRRIVGPFNRVEGDLEVQLQIEDSLVTNAWVVSPLYRGFEQILQGKDPVDALVYVPRICGICSVSQSVAAASALANCQGLNPPPNGEIATNLILAILFSFRQFLQQTLFADQLENIIALDSADALSHWLERPGSLNSDFGRFLHIANVLNLESLGRANDNFMSYGVYPEQGEPLFAMGTYRFASGTREGIRGVLDQTKIQEDISHSWMKLQNKPRHPFDGVTIPSAEVPDAYTWCKAPRLNGQVMEVGALARQVVNGHPLMRDLVAKNGANVKNRVIARLLEIAQVVVAMEGWAKALKPNEPFCLHAKMPDEAQGFGIMEAARGSLGHWLKVKKGRILNYQIIAPTTWNFSPRDNQGVSGVLEQALINTPLRNDDKMPIEVQHIVRSFDPCMVCTVH